MRRNPHLIGTNEPPALILAYEHVRDWSVAIDGGAYIGNWSAAMSKRFGAVHAFEPAPDLIGGLRDRFANTNVTVNHAALWSTEEMVDLHLDPTHPAKEFGRHVKTGNDIQALSIDSLDLKQCGLIKLDLEGAEMKALRGAIRTINRCLPVIICECKASAAAHYKASPEEPGRFLEELGYREFARFKPDRLYRYNP